jgi:hypothetical protein
VPPATLSINAPTISGADSKPRPIAHPVDSINANPNYTKSETLLEVPFFLSDAPNEMAITN